MFAHPDEVIFFGSPITTMDSNCLLSSHQPRRTFIQDNNYRNRNQQPAGEPEGDGIAGLVGKLGG
jgi:hypothetical protein